MIPKIIHLCWFGKNPFPPLIEYCVKSWEKKLPDYKIMLWNEDSFDVNNLLWTKQAYEKKKWAFVSDYVRLYALKKYGGVYLDTDLEVIKDFTELIKDDTFAISFLEGDLISMGFIACEPNSKHLDNLMTYYETKNFVNDDGSLNEIMNNLIYTRLVIDKYGLEFGAKTFEHDGYCIYPMEMFMPYKKNFFLERTNKKSYILSKNTYTIHHDMGSWDNDSKLLRKLKYLVRLVVPSKFYLIIKKRINKRKINNG